MDLAFSLFIHFSTYTPQLHQQDSGAVARARTALHVSTQNFWPEINFLKYLVL